MCVAPAQVTQIAAEPYYSAQTNPILRFIESGTSHPLSCSQRALTACV
jgi:hypothetical protein